MPSIRENTSITQVARKACVALIVVFVFVALVVWLQMQATYVADGRLCAQIRFRVVDRVSGTPISGATVRMRNMWGTGREAPVTDDAANERGVLTYSDEDGQVNLEYEFPVSHTHRIIGSDTIVSFPEWLWLDVRASSYSPILSPLRDVVGLSCAPEDFPIGPVEISLERIE